MWVFVLLVLASYTLANESVIPSKTEYERYLDQMLMAFRDDPKVADILKKATEEDIKNGIVEKTLRRLHPDIRSKLDEVKRTIISEYKMKLRKAKLDDNIPDELNKFGDDDLKHLLKERHERLKAMDGQRLKQFKKYEMEKELKHKMMLRAMNEYDRKVQEALDEEEKEKHKEKEKQMKHPGSKDQFEGAWEADGFDKETFNPKTFFKMHDLDGNNEWDMFELEAIFEKEVEQLFEGFDDADEEEKAEEVARMREHVTKHMDKNGDDFIQLSEFIEYTKGKDFNANDPWESLYSEDQFDEAEFKEFEKEVENEPEEKKRLEEEALVDLKKKEEKIRKYEEESKINMEMLKEHSEKLKEALKAAAKFKELENAKKIVEEANKETANQG